MYKRQAYSGDTSNQADCFDDDFKAVEILQAPEFISGNESKPTTNVNPDSYLRYIDPYAINTVPYGEKPVDAVIPSGRTCRYTFYDETNGDSLTVANSLLSINATTGVITVGRPMTASEIATPPSFKIKAYDSVHNQLYDLATLTICLLYTSRCV